MKYLIAVVLIFNCFALQAADRPAGEVQVAIVLPSDFAQSSMPDAFDPSVISERYDFEALSAVQAGYSEGNSAVFVSRDDGRRSSSVSIPAALWLFGSILIGLTTMASRHFFSNTRF